MTPQFSTNKFDLKKMVLLYSLVLVHGIQLAQEVKIDSVSKKKYITVNVVETYERIVAKGYNNPELLEYLGIHYYNVHNIVKSKIYFDLLFKKCQRSKISAKTVAIYKTL